MTKVKEIKICGDIVSNRLYNACREYVGAIKLGTDKPELNFTIQLDNGEVKHITFRQMDDGIQVYGDFTGMPNALEWAKRVTGGK